MNIDFKKVYEKADEYKPAISKFLRDMIAIPSESRQEAKVIQRIKAEMETVGFDRVNIDPMGNILGYIGNGRHLVAMDAHVDTVGVGDPDQWEYDPYKGYEDDEIIVGRGASDQEGGMAAERGVDAAAMEREFFETARPTSLLQRFATPDEVAAMIAYVCSAQASATTGAALRVDGGVVRAIA